MTTFSNDPIWAAASRRQLVEDERPDHLRRIVLPLDHLVINPLPHVAFETFGDLGRVRRRHLEDLRADDHVLPLEQHHAGRRTVPLAVDHGDGVAGFVQPSQHGEGCTRSMPTAGTDCLVIVLAFTPLVHPVNNRYTSRLCFSITSIRRYANAQPPSYVSSPVYWVRRIIAWRLLALAAEEEKDDFINNKS